MTDSGTASAAIGRLAHQLHTLSQLSESLTYRLLELEERVAALDLLLQPLLAARSAQSAQLSEDAELRLEDTESRLTRLESMLSDLDGAARDSAAAVQSVPLNQAGQPFELFSDQLADDDVADDDQLFLDEQALVPELEVDEVQEFPADDVDEDQRLIA
jgi:uncharacterized coiled-coil protein SlyX